MERIDTSTAAAVMPTPGAAGTPGFFTDGNPNTATPATVVDQDWFNNMQEEVASVIEAAGITLDKTKQDQLLLAIQSGLTGHGQCRLSVASATSLKLSPFNGNRLIIDDVSQKIPSAGVTISNTGLVASTLYYVYAYMNAGAMALELSATGHSTDTNGIEIKTGDSTRTLVGMLYTDASGQFVDSAIFRGVLNWFNRRNIIAKNNVASVTSSSLSPVELTTSARVTFLSWGDEWSIADGVGFASNNTIDDGYEAWIAFDATSGASGFAGGGISFSAAAQTGIISQNDTQLTEGNHFATMIASVSGGGTGTFTFGYRIMTQG